MDVLYRGPQDVRERVRDQIWLKTMLVEQRRRMPAGVRALFDERADKILALLDPEDHDDSWELG